MDCFGTTLTNEVSQGTDRCQTLIARRCATAAFLLQLQQKGPDAICREVFHTEAIDRLAAGSGGEGQEYPQGVAVALLRVPRQVPLCDQVFPIVSFVKTVTLSSAGQPAPVIVTVAPGG